MAVETVNIALAADKWTVIATGKESVTFQLQKIGVARFYIGPTAPAGRRGIVFTERQAPALSSLTSADNVYVASADVANEIEVVRG